MHNRRDERDRRRWRDREAERLERQRDRETGEIGEAGETGEIGETPAAAARFRPLPEGVCRTEPGKRQLAKNLSRAQKARESSPEQAAEVVSRSAFGARSRSGCTRQRTTLTTIHSLRPKRTVVSLCAPAIGKAVAGRYKAPAKPPKVRKHAKEDDVNGNPWLAAETHGS